MVVCKKILSADHFFFSRLKFNFQEWSNRNLILDAKYHVPKELAISIVTPARVTLHVRAFDSWTINRMKSAIYDIGGTQHSHRLLEFKSKFL